MKYIGKPYQRVEGKEKILGKILYVDDMRMPGMLHVSVVRSSIPHGKVTKIDSSKAMIDGVVGVYTAKDIPGKNLYGFPTTDNHLLIEDEVKYIGDAIAIVVAETKEIANEATKLVEVTYEELKGAFDPKDPGAESFAKLVVKKNVEKENEIADDDVVIEMKLSTQHQEHAYIEPEGGFAYYDEDGKLNIFGPMQGPHIAKYNMQDFFALKSDEVRVVQSTCGGAFGGKDDIVYEAMGYAALGTYMTKKPCKFVASREESIVTSYKRHPIQCDLKLVSDKEGNFKGIKVRNKMDGGPYGSVSKLVQFRNTTHSGGPYVYDWTDVENEVYYTNSPWCAAFRGFGGLQAAYFYDTAIDELSYKLGMDPIDLRLKNVWRRGTTTPTDQPVDWDPSIEALLTKIRKTSDWDEKKKEFEEFNKTSKYYKKGIGVSLALHGTGLGAEGVDAAQSEVIFDKKSQKLIITQGVSDLGQGSRTVFSQMASEVLQLPPEYIISNNYDTDITLDSGATVASRGTTTGGGAVIAASENFVKYIREKAAEMYNVSYIDVGYEEGYIYIDGKKEIFVIDLCNKISEKEEVRVYGKFKLPDIAWDEHTGLGKPYIMYHYGVHVSYITLDTVTGKVNVDKYFAIHDVGRVINPIQLKGQLYGGIATGLGYALTETLDVHNGKISNKNFDKYIIATSEDMPEMNIDFYESVEHEGPFGAKGTGEPVLSPVPACIGNAIRFATGKRFTDLPFSLEKMVCGKELSKYAK